MTLMTVLTLACAFAGGLLLLAGATSTAHSADNMLNHYKDLLSAAREQLAAERAREAAERAAADAE